MSKTPLISSFSPQSSSPVLKTLLNIKGTGFSSPVNVYLTALNDTNREIYECSIVSINESVIQCVLPGGSSGKYRLKVVISGKGSCDYQEKTKNSYDVYEYKILVSSINPSQGSVYGGTLLRIQGENFATAASQNQITLSVAETNIICDITLFSETSLQCITRSAPKQQETNTTVRVLSRLIESAQCNIKENACLFNYSRKATPALTNAAKLSKSSFFPGEFVTLQGNLLINSTKAFLNATEVAVISQDNGTLLMKIPDNSSFGAYFLTLRSDLYGFGDTQGATIKIKAQVLGIDSRKFYVSGGLLSIQGQGFRDIGDLSVELAPGLVGDVIICKIIQEIISPEKIQCLTGNLKAGLNYKVNLKMMSQYYSCSLCSFDVKPMNSSETPAITSVSSAEINEEIGEILTIQANYLSNCEHFDVIFLNNNQEKSYYFSEFYLKRTSQNSLALNFSQLGLLNANYSLKINCQSLQASCFLLTRVSQAFPSIFVNYAAKIYPIQQVSSFEGSNFLYFQRKGQNISSKSLRICGIPCTPAFFNESHYIIETPQLSTENTRKYYGIREKFEIINEKVDWFADTPNNLLINSNNFEGFSYISADPSQCFIGFFSAENVKIKLKWIKLYIPLENNEKFQGMRLENSQDNTSFAVVKEFDAYLLEGWYTLTVDNSISAARFWRVKQENQKLAPYSK